MFRCRVLSGLILLSLLCTSFSECNEQVDYLRSVDAIQNAVPEVSWRLNCTKRIAIGAAHLSGHLTPLLGIAQELAKRGCIVEFPIAKDKAWAVEAITPVLGYDGEMHEIVVIPLEGAQEMDESLRKEISENFFKFMYKNFFKVMRQFVALTESFYDPLVARWSNPQTRPDAMVAMISAMGQIAAAETLKIPVIHTQPGIIMQKAFTYHFVPPMGFGIDIDTYSQNRPLRWAIETLYRPADYALTRISLFMMNSFRTEKGLPPSDMNPSLNLQQTSFGLEYSQPIPPSFQMVGPVFPEKDEPLSPELKTWLDESIVTGCTEDSEECSGVVYVCMGTTSILWPELGERMATALSKFPRVLWSLPKSQWEYLPEFVFSLPHIRLEPFTPQRAVLQHPNVVLFYSHTGASSTHEGLFYEVPLVCMPFFGDQTELCQRVVSAKAGLFVSKNAESADEIQDVLESLFADYSSYKHNAIRISKLFKMSGGAVKAGDLILQYIDSGFDHLRLPHLREGVTEFEKYGWDLFLLQVFLYILLPYIVIFKCLFGCCCSCGKSRREKKMKTQ